MSVLSHRVTDIKKPIYENLYSFDCFILVIIIRVIIIVIIITIIVFVWHFAHEIPTLYAKIDDAEIL